jgi:hypothetical protein
MKLQGFLLKVAIAQGACAATLYAVTVIVGGLLHPGYSHITQAISELSAAGAVNERVLTACFALVEALTVVFASGFFLAVRGTNRSLSASAVLMSAMGFVGLGFARFPMDQVGTPMTADGQAHIALVILSVPLAIAAVALSMLGWRRQPEGGSMALISFIALCAMLLSGVISGVGVVNGWSVIGIWERVNIGAFLFWQAATAIYLLRRA